MSHPDAVDVPEGLIHEPIQFADRVVPDEEYEEAKARDGIHTPGGTDRIADRPFAENE